MELSSEWKENDGKIMRTFKFDNFSHALEFINKVGEIAENLNHHPEIWNSYNKVILNLSTHDADAITDKDYILAREIDLL